MGSLLIVNPAAGADRGARLAERMRARLRPVFGDVALVATGGEGDARAAARRAVGDGYDHLFVAGGDGTLNEVLNGVCDAARGLAPVTFGIVPLGTGNDFATALGIPEEVDEAIEVLNARRERMVDVGVMNGHHFVNVSAGGFIAEVSSAVTPELKTVAGKLAYLIGGAQVLFTHEPIRARCRTADAVREVTIETFAVCNSRLVGGGRLIAPHAILDDGQLDACLFEDMSSVEFIALLRRVSAGEHLADERVHYFRSAKLEIAFDRPVKVNVDGQVTETDRCRYTVLPRAARFLANPSGHPLDARS